jgi:CelD/BcsL family acetyltransferase involved in cellulose biosynthesis
VNAYLHATCLATPIPVPENRVIAAAQRGGSELVDSVAGEWRELCAETEMAPFHHPEWIAAYLRAFAPAANVRLLTARAGSRLCAVLPLTEENTFCGLPARVLRGASNVHSTRFDVVVARQQAAATISQVWRCLKEMDDWDVLEIKDAPAGGGAEQLLALAASEQYPVGQWKTDDTPYVSLAGAANALQVIPSGEFRRNLRRHMRRASEKWSVELCRVDSADSEDLRQFYALEMSGWKGRRKTAIASRPATQLFYDEVARAASALGYFSLYLLRFDGVPVAGHFGLTCRGRYYAPKVAYDEQYASVGPGHLLVEAALRDCIYRGIGEYDTVGPSTPWKLKWTSTTRSHAHCYVFRKSAYGRILHAAKCRFMAGLRAASHRPLVSGLRALLKTGDE